MQAVSELLVNCRLSSLLSNDPREEKHPQLRLQSFLFQTYTLLVQESSKPIGVNGTRKQVSYYVMLLFKGAQAEEPRKVPRVRIKQEYAEDHLRE